jgi:hypothetical protein
MLHLGGALPSIRADCHRDQTVNDLKVSEAVLIEQFSSNNRTRFRSRLTVRKFRHWKSAQRGRRAFLSWPVFLSFAFSSGMLATLSYMIIRLLALPATYSPPSHH